MVEIIIEKPQCPQDIKPQCEVCKHNQGYQTGWAGVIGPCGQQHCWYDCTCCKYNNYGKCPIEEQEEQDEEI